jgi:hypothetical protein
VIPPCSSMSTLPNVLIRFLHEIYRHFRPRSIATASSSGERHLPSSVPSLEGDKVTRNPRTSLLIRSISAQAKRSKVADRY